MQASSPNPEHYFRFPKSIRLLARRDYLRVQKQGILVRSKDLLVLYKKGNGKNARFGMTVSKKVGNAVTRNRVKRWIREAVRHHHHCVDSQVDVVFIASPRTARSNYQSIEREISTALETIAAQDQ